MIGDLRPTRRELLRWLAYGSAGSALGVTLPACSSDGRRTAPVRPVRGDARLLVVVELGGGNDGLSTFVPYEDGHYHDLRPTLALSADEVIPWSDGWGLNARLRTLHDAGVAVVPGVGSTQPDLSHFAMLDRWWRGTVGPPDPAAPPVTTGFLGRLCDAVRGEERFTGVSLRFGNAPPLRSAEAATTGLPDVETDFLHAHPDSAPAIRAAITALASGAASGPLAQAREGAARLLWILDLLDELPPAAPGYPEHDFGTQMAIASRVARSSAGARIIHVPMGGSDFDTHQNHRSTHDRLMTELDEGLAAFMRDMDDAGMADRVLIATMSEFGRRPEEHDGGLDHGTASTMLLLGPVEPGVHGDHSSLSSFDEHDNFVATTTFDRYFATLASWLEVPPEQVLDSLGGTPPVPYEGVLRA